MDETLKAKLVQYLEKMEHAATVATDFAAAEIPATVREYLMWLLIENIISAVAFACIVPLLWFTGKAMRAYAAKEKAERQNRRSSDLPEDFCFGVGNILRFACFAPLFGTLIFGLQATKIAVAPRVVILEKVAGLTGIVKKDK